MQRHLLVFKTRPLISVARGISAQQQALLFSTDTLATGPVSSPTAKDGYISKLQNAGFSLAEATHLVECLDSTVAHS